MTNPASAVGTIINSLCANRREALPSHSDSCHQLIEGHPGKDALFAFFSGITSNKFFLGSAIKNKLHSPNNLIEGRSNDERRNPLSTNFVGNPENFPEAAGPARQANAQLLNKTNSLLQPCLIGGRYRNYDEGHPSLHLWQATRIGLATLQNRIWNTFSNCSLDNEPSAQVTRVLPLALNEGSSVQWIGHASVLIQVGAHNILTDPIFGDLGKFKLGPINFALYGRRSQVGIDPEALPPIDFVLISHTHRDHLDKPSLRLLRKDKKHQNMKILAPAGSAYLFENMGFEKERICTYATWWESRKFSEPNKSKLTITFVPAKHWSGRGLIDVNKQLWGGWMIEDNDKKTTTYFVGDTGMDQKMFEQIHQQFSNINTLLMPIGPCEPRSLMAHSHISPSEAVAATDILQPRHMVPIHHSTYGLGPDPKLAPLKGLKQAWDASFRQNNQTALHVLQPSERFDLEFGVTPISIT